MLYPTLTVAPDSRDDDGYYMIASSHLHIFPFTVPYLGLQQIKVAHMMPNSQDWSLDFYISGKPSGPALFTADNATGHWRLDRVEDVINIWSEGAEEAGKLTLPPGQTYYVMVRNLQNQDNGYKLTFSV